MPILPVVKSFGVWRLVAAFPVTRVNTKAATRRHTPKMLALLCLCLFPVTASAQLERRAQEVLDRAVADFQSGRIEKSVEGFDKLAKLVPAIAPQLWQRGIALYYAGRYRDCRTQFESHRTVNPNDVENAAWHFLCVARAESPEKARSALLPVGPDSRVPMIEIYEMFRGTRKPQDVLAAAGTRPEAEFYARLYLGLYYEALGNESLARENITAAAADRFASAGDYMHGVAKVHMKILQKRRK
jgi:lipoprotein NlpI